MIRKVVSAAALSVLMLNGASAATVDIIDASSSGAWANYFVPDEESTYSTPYYRGYGEDWSWIHNAIDTAFTAATLMISAFDVDFSDGEFDLIQVKSGGDWIDLGYLGGGNDVYAYTEFNLDSSLFDEIASGLELRLAIDQGASGWLVTLAKSVITTDGAVAPPAEPGVAPVPLPAALPLLLGGIAALGGLRLRRRLRA